MTTDVQTATSPFTTARAAFAHTIGNALGTAHTSTGQIATLADNLLTMMHATNGASFTLTIGAGDKAKDVTVSRAVLINYASGMLPSKVSDATPDAPTASQLIDAIVCLSPAVGEKQAEADAANAAVKAEQNGFRKLAEQAKADRANATLNTVKQPIRRALTLAAYVELMQGRGVAGDYVPEQSKVVNGTLFVGMRQTDDVSKTDWVAVPFSNASGAFRKERAPKAGGKSDTVVDGGDSDAPAAFTLSPEAVRTGGKPREQLATVLDGINAILSKLDGTPSAAERHAMMRLYTTLEPHFDDDDLAKIGEMRDARDGE